MCRYFSGFFHHHPLLADFDYYWRVEPDVHYYCNLDYDPFVFMQQKCARNPAKVGYQMAPATTMLMHMCLMCGWSTQNPLAHRLCHLAALGKPRLMPVAYRLCCSVLSCIRLRSGCYFCSPHSRALTAELLRARLHSSYLLPPQLR